MAFATPSKSDGECPLPAAQLAYLAEPATPTNLKRSLDFTSISDTPEGAGETPDDAIRRQLQRSKLIPRLDAEWGEVHAESAAGGCGESGIAVQSAVRAPTPSLRLAALPEADDDVTIIWVEKPTDPPPTEELSQAPTEADQTPRGHVSRRRCLAPFLEENVDIFLKHGCFIRQLEDLQGPKEAVTLRVYLECSKEMKQELINRLGTHEEKDRVTSSLPPSLPPFLPPSLRSK